MRYLINIKNLSKKSFKKETKRALLNILETEDSYLNPNEIMLKFKHSKTEPIWTSATICFLHWETLGLSFLYKWTFVIFFFFPFLVYLFVFFYGTFLHFCFISSVLKLSKLRKKNDPPQLAFAICRSKEFLVNMYENKNKSVKWSESQHVRKCMITN